MRLPSSQEERVMFRQNVIALIEIIVAALGAAVADLILSFIFGYDHTPMKFMDFLIFYGTMMIIVIRNRLEKEHER